MPSSEVMHKWTKGKLHSGSKKGPKVEGQKQALAIMFSEKRKEAQHGGKYPEPKPTKGKKKKKGKMMSHKANAALQKIQG